MSLVVILCFFFAVVLPAAGQETAPDNNCSISKALLENTVSALLQQSKQLQNSALDHRQSQRGSNRCCRSQLDVAVSALQSKVSAMESQLTQTKEDLASLQRLMSPLHKQGIVARFHCNV